jgi:hypothetical protein
MGCLLNLERGKARLGLAEQAAFDPKHKAAYVPTAIPKPRLLVFA